MRDVQRFRRLNIVELVEFTESLAMLLNSGIPVQDALKINCDLMHRPILSSVTRELISGIRKGKSLSSSMARAGNAFEPSYIGVVRVGEEVGSLSHLFDLYGKHLGRTKMISEKITSASIYPVLVLTMVFAGLIAFALFFLPELLNLFENLDPEQANSLRTSVWNTLTASAVAITSVLLIFFTHRIYLLVRGKSLDASFFIRFWEKLLFSIPFLRKLLIDVELFNLYFVVFSQVENGISIEKAIEAAMPSINVERLRKDLGIVVSKLRKGDQLSIALESTGRMFPLKMINWIRIGEKIGEPAKVFRQLYHFQESHLDIVYSRLLSLLEPVLTIGVGAILVAIILNFIVPFFSLLTGIIQ
jgi:type II secretory pathway component PulF